MVPRCHLSQAHLLPCETIFKMQICGGQSMSHSSGLQERTPTSKEVLVEKAEGVGCCSIQLTFPQKLERWPRIREPCAEIP